MDKHGSMLSVHAASIPYNTLIYCFSLCWITDYLPREKASSDTPFPAERHHSFVLRAANA